MLGTEWSIDADSRNVILRQLRTNKAGEAEWIIIGYYHTMGMAAKAAACHMIHDRLALSEFETLADFEAALIATVEALT